MKLLSVLKKKKTLLAIPVIALAVTVGVATGDSSQFAAEQPVPEPTHGSQTIDVTEGAVEPVVEPGATSEPLETSEQGVTPEPSGEPALNTSEAGEPEPPVEPQEPPYIVSISKRIEPVSPENMYKIRNYDSKKTYKQVYCDHNYSNGSVQSVFAGITTGPEISC